MTHNLSEDFPPLDSYAEWAAAIPEIERMMLDTDASIINGVGGYGEDDPEYATIAHEEREFNRPERIRAFARRVFDLLR